MPFAIALLVRISSYRARDVGHARTHSIRRVCLGGSRAAIRVAVRYAVMHSIMVKVGFDSSEFGFIDVSSRRLPNILDNMYEISLH